MSSGRPAQVSPCNQRAPEERLHLMPSSTLNAPPELALVARANALCDEACSMQEAGEFARASAVLEQAELLCEQADAILDDGGVAQLTHR